ncbi:MAG: HAD-IA family hydrolase [Bacteroidota bacterium]
MKHIFFDCDGVLVDSEIIANRVWVQRLERMGLSMTEKTFIQTYAGKREEEVRRQIQAEYGLTFEEDFLENILKELDERIHAELQAVAGMRELVFSITIPKSVVSNSSQYQAKRSLQLTGMWEAFEGRCFTSDQVINPKPAPDVYLHALNQTQQEKDSSIVVEDSATGVSAAKAAGLQVIGFLGASHIMEGHDKKLEAAGADWVARNAEEVGTLLTKLEFIT